MFTSRSRLRDTADAHKLSARWHIGGKGSAGGGVLRKTAAVTPDGVCTAVP
jgi:hypothetical protein